MSEILVTPVKCNFTFKSFFFPLKDVPSSIPSIPDNAATSGEKGNSQIENGKQPVKGWRKADVQMHNFT